MDARVTPLSIIVPCLNEEAGIVAALEALMPLRARGAEVIVVDGGSTDATVALARPRCDSVLEAPRGRGRQMNAGAARARGEVIVFLHSDSRLPERSDSLITVGLAGCRRQWGRFDVTIGGDHPLLRIIGTFMNARSRWTGIATGDQAIFVKRELFETLGGYREIALMEDIELSERLKAHSAPLSLRHKVVTSGRRWERNGVLRTVLLMWRLRLAYRFGVDPAKLALLYASNR